MTKTETTRRRRNPRCTRAAVIGTCLLIVTASCGGDDDTNEPATSVDEAPTTSAVTEERVSDIDTPPTSATTPEASDASTATIAEPPGLVDLAVVGHGASLVEVSTEWDESTWSAVNLIDGRADRGWAGSEPGGAFVIGLAHPTIQSISIDTTEAEEQKYPGISAARVEIERATDLSTFPDLDWEPVGVIELGPQTIGTLETPDLLAPMLRFRVENGGNPTWVEIMEVSAWGELTEASSTLDMLEVVNVAASERPNTVLFGNEWAFHPDPDGTVLACSTDGSSVDLAPVNGALVGTLTAADGSRGEILVSGAAATVTVAIDAGGDPQVAWGVLKPGPLSCESEGTGPTKPDLVEIDASGERRADPPLTVAAFNEDIDEVVRLLDAGEDPNVAEEQKGWTPLLFAAQAGDSEIVRALVDAGADIDRGSDDGWTPLMIASQNGHDNTVDLLLDAGANVLVARADNWTALHSAVTNERVGATRLLIDAGAPLEAARDGFTPLTYAAQEGLDAFVMLLLDAGANPSGARADGPTPLLMAAQNGHGQLITQLVAAGADPDDGGTEGPPLIQAAGRGQVELFALLVDSGADVDIRGGQGGGWTALMWAANNDDPAAIEELLRLGADPRVRSDDGESAKDIAERFGNTDALTALKGS